MTRNTIKKQLASATVVVAFALAAVSASAQTMADYTASPAFISDTVPPNILIVFDNSGSMKNMAYRDDSFDVKKSYAGIFDHTECYTYTNNRFEPNPAANTAGPATCPDSNYPWSGNLLNYATMRRVDMAKWALIGGNCVGARDAQSRCTTELTAETKDISNKYISTSKGSLSNKQVMPQKLLDDPGLGGTVYFLNPGSVSKLQGYFCVDNDNNYPNSGDSDCKSSDGDAYDEGAISDKYRIAVQLTRPAGGVLQDVGNKARLGLMKFDESGNNEGGEVIADVGTDVGTLVSTLEATGAPGKSWTMLAETLYTAARYFAQIAPPYAGSAYTVNKNNDPYYFQAPQWAAADTYVSCCESFVIIFTDGESTRDLNIPSSLQDYAHAVHGKHGSGGNDHETSYGSDGSHYLDDVAYWVHINDLRQSTVPVIGGSGKDLKDIQNLTVYTFFAFGSGSELLQAAAKAGGFEDLNGNNQPDLDDEWDRIINNTGEEGKDGVPDTYFESNDAELIKDRLLAAISSILQRSGSGSAASVLASSSTGEGAVYQSYFYPSTVEGLKDIKWTGHTHGLFLDVFGNLREDSNGDGKLVYKDDMIIRMTFDTTTNQVMAERYADVSPADGLADSTTPVGGAVELRNVKGIWEAGKRLALADPNNRNILTWIDKDNDGVVDAGEQIDFTTGNKNDLAPYLRPGANPFNVDNIIKFVRGEQPKGLRNRELTVSGSQKVWKMGDPIHSRPIVVGAPTQRYDIIYGDTSYTAFFAKYKSRRQVAYVGANDGMLHAFNAGFYHRGDDSGTTDEEHGWFTTTAPGVTNTPALGEELFGFIPQELLPHLIYLTRPDYTHVYYVDLTPKVTDARIFTPDADHPDGWGTILMGGFRLGGSCGSCPVGNGSPMTVNDDFNYDGDTIDAGDTRTFYSAYFVLDITNPEAAGYPKLLWSFSKSDLGFTTTTPSMLRVSPKTSSLTDNTDAKWYMLVGSGPTGYDGRITQGGKLYAIDLAQGPGSNNSKVTTMNAESMDAFLADPVTVDRDFDYRVDAAYMGGVINDGSLPWRGKLYRLTMNTCALTGCDTSTWGILDGLGRQPTEILDTFPTSGANELGPVTSGVAVAVDDSNKLWVFAGTGRYFDTIDKTSTAQQHFVGVKDKVLFGACTETTRTNCHSKDLVDVSSAKVCLMGTGNCGGTTDQVTGVGGASDFPSLIALVASKDGWFTTLPDTGERALSRPLAIGGLVLFPTFVPTSGTCGAQGESYLYALYYLTGSAYSAPVIGTTTSGGETYNKRDTKLGSGMASQAVVHIGEGGSGGGAKAFIQKSTAEMVDLDMRTAGAAIVSRFVTWYNARQ